MKKRAEILAPAGGKEALLAGISAGADAFYIGGTKFGARAYADNPSQDELLELIDLVHLYDKKIYLTLNTLLKEDEFSEMLSFLTPLYKAGLDAVIVQDLGVLKVVRECFPQLSIHASTQMSITSRFGASFLKDQGVERIVPARELSLEELLRIKKETDIELECFVHGAMCYAYSGQCLFSSLLGGRSGNRGQCAQPCRLPYMVDKVKHDYLSMKDLCTLDLLPELILAGISSFKIEGRMKSPSYVYQVVSMYRKYRDLYYDKKDYVVSVEDKRTLEAAYQRRGYSSGYYQEKNKANLIVKQRPKVRQEVKEPVTFSLPKLPVVASMALYPDALPYIVVHFFERTVYVTGDVPVTKAKTQPLSKEKIKEQFNKTGNTSFYFSRLDIDMSEDIFMPIKELNALRRKAFSALCKSVFKEYRREVYETPKLPLKSLQNDNHTCIITVKVETKDQLLAVQKNQKIGQIYTPASLLEYQGNDSRIYPALPYVLREQDESDLHKLYQTVISPSRGVLIRSIDELGWLRSLSYTGTIICDANLYCMNHYAQDFLKNLGVLRTTTSVELNKKELKNLDQSTSEIMVYGKLPLMITANCPGAFKDGCDKHRKSIILEDRKGIKFTVKKYCEYCYNIIYNSVPIVLLAEEKEISALKPAAISLSFTTEDQYETKEIIEAYCGVYIDKKAATINMKNYTKGHYNRGVL